MADLPILTDENFAGEVKSHKGVAIVDFFGEWCGPCKAFAPVFEAFAAAHPEVKCVKAEVGGVPGAASELGIMAVPTIVFFKDGTPAETLQGAVGAPALEEALAKVG